MAGIAIVGSINTDISIHIKKMAKLGETVRGENYRVSCGGKGANQAIAAAHFSKNVSMIGLAGNDDYADLCISTLTRNNVNCEGVGKAEINTGVAMITVAGGDNMIILNDGANALVNIDYIKENQHLIENAQYVIFQFEIPLKTVFEAIKYVKSLGKKVVLNPAPIYEIPDDIYENIDIFILNEHEASSVLGYEVNSQNATEAVKNICAKGAEQVVITLGSYGCVYNNGSDIISKEALKVNAIDTTAAGDTFIGAFCSCLLNKKSVNEAVEFATFASAITVSREGAADSIPFLEEVEAYMEKQRAAEREIKE